MKMLLKYFTKPANERGEVEIDFVKTARTVTVFIIVIWLITLLSLVFIESDLRGTFGDMFGSVNALFSGLALAGIILTILMQKQELKLQRDELSETRKEFATQNETLKLQRFENTFFNLLNLHHQIVNAIDYGSYANKSFGGIMKGGYERERIVINARDVFKNRYEPLKHQIFKEPSKYEQIYLKQYAEMQMDFGHYFRNLYRMIKLVNETDFFYDSKNVNEKQIFQIKYKYTSIIRSQLSDYELAWLFYNCLSVNGNEKFKPLIQKYVLLKNLPSGLVYIDHLVLYEKSAFKRE